MTTSIKINGSPLYRLFKKIYKKIKCEKIFTIQVFRSEEGDAKKYWYSDFLSVSAIKFRIRWLF